MRLPLIESPQPRRNNRPAVCRPVELKGALTAASSALLMAGSVPEAIMPPIFPLAIFKWTSLCLQTHFCGGEVSEGSGSGLCTSSPQGAVIFKPQCHNQRRAPASPLCETLLTKWQAWGGGGLCKMPPRVRLHAHKYPRFLPLFQKKIIFGPRRFHGWWKWIFCYFSCLGAAKLIFKSLQSKAVVCCKNFAPFFFFSSLAKLQSCRSCCATLFQVLCNNVVQVIVVVAMHEKWATANAAVDYTGILDGVLLGEIHPGRVQCWRKGRKLPNVPQLFN